MNRKELVEKLELVSRALAQTDIIPIFKCFAFNKRTVTAYNDALAIKAPCHTEEAFCVNGKVLLGLLTNSYSEEVNFKIDGQELRVTTGKSVFRLPWFPIEDFLFKAPTEPSFVCNITGDFLGGLSACLMTSSKDISQAGLMGVFLTGSSIYSTDGDAITRYGKPNKDSSGDMLPNSFCETLIKIDSMGLLHINREWAEAKLDNGLFVFGRLIEVETPIDYEMWIRKTLHHDARWVEIPKGLDRALSRARVIADPESSPTLVQIAGSKMKLLTETAMGQINDSVIYNDKSFAVTAKISAELMQRCISLCNEISVFDNCSVFRNGDKLFILTSNMGK